MFLLRLQTKLLYFMYQYLSLTFKNTDVAHICLYCIFWLIVSIILFTDSIHAFTNPLGFDPADVL